jgi:hypothetical protein
MLVLRANQLRYLTEMYQFSDISQERQHQNCDSACVSSPNEYKSWLPSSLSFLIILLPKCPFCIVAYTSSMAMCGASPLVSHHTDWGAWVALFLGSVILYSIYRNRRGPGTAFAVAMAFVGLLLVTIGVFVADAFVCYYLGSIVLLLAAFFNGSGFRFINMLFSYKVRK